MAKKHLVMLVDLKRCIGCHTCAVACKLENNLPNKIWWNRVLTVGGQEMDTPQGVFPNVKMQYMTLSCQHCENPACVKVCPVGATYKREEDGIVVQDYDRCIGCRYCIVACPYTGVRQFNWQKPEYDIDFPVGDAQSGSSIQCSRKMYFFSPPWPRPGRPVLKYAGKGTPFGDLNDPNSEVSRLLKRRSHFQLLGEKGTGPSVYYLT